MAKTKTTIMKWINSSERLPKEKGGYHIKLRGHKATMYFSGKRWETYESTNQNTIDWLDENDNSEIERLEKELESLKRYLKAQLLDDNHY